MNHTVQIFAGIAVLLITSVIMKLFWKIATDSSPVEEYKKVTEKGYAMRRKYFYGLLVGSVIFSGLGIYMLPYPQLREAVAMSNPHVVKVTAVQFAFDISETKLPVGMVRFDVTSTDVNHGFGIYDEAGMLVAQTQAMPDYVNKLYVNFTKPGKYQVWCLEYCGVVHHSMMTEFEVTEGGNSNG